MCNWCLDNYKKREGKKCLRVDAKNEMLGQPYVPSVNGSQLAKMKKNVPDMSLPWNL